MATKLQRKWKFIQDLNKLSRKPKIQYLNKCPDDYIDILCQGCFNLLKNPQLKNKKKVKNLLKPVMSKVKHLTDRNTEIYQKRQILTKGKIAKIITSTLAKHLVPFLKETIQKSLKE